MKKILLFVIIIFSSCAESIISVKPTQQITLDKIKKNYDIFGYYYLPKTVLKLRVPIVKNNYAQSKFIKDKCLESFLKTNFGWEYLKKPTDIFTLGKKIIISTEHVPDPEKRYAIAYKNSKTISQTLNLSLSKEGLIQSGEFAQESKVYEVSKKSLEILGSVIGAVGGLGVSNIDNDNSFSCIKSERAKVLIKKVIELQKAKYNRLNEYPVGANTAATGKFIFEQIDKELAIVKKELLGSIEKKVHYVTIEIEPKVKFTSKNLFVLNPNLGVVKDSKTNLFTSLPDQISKQGKPIKQGKPNGKLLKLVVLDDISPQNSSVLSTQATEKEGVISSEAFLFYNVPAIYKLQLQYDNKVLSSYGSDKDKNGSNTYSVFFPQLGKVTYLPKDFKESNVVYYEDIGGLKSVKLTKEASVNAERLEGLYSSIDSIRKTFKSIKENNAPKEEVEETEEVEEQVIRLIIENSNGSDVLKKQN